jgi:hypothetical protein
LSTTFALPVSHAIQTREIPAAIRSPQVGSRTRTAVVATESNVEVFDGRTGRVVLEKLLLDGVEVGNYAPLLLDHQRSITTTAGSCSTFRREGDNLLADLAFSGNMAGSEAWELVRENHIRAVSVGYRATEAVEIPAGRSRTIGSRTFTAPQNQSLRVVSRWQLKEVSLVPIGADDAAQIRSYPNHFSRGQNMSAPISQVIGQRDVRHMSLSEFCAVGLRSRHQPVPENDRDCIRAGLSSVEGVADLAGLVNTSVLDGFRSVPDSLAGIYSVVPLPNFISAHLATVSTVPRLERVGRHQVAPHISFDFTSQGWQLCRFGAQFILSEEDELDTQRIGIFATALEEVGRAARRLIPDLLWSLLLENPTLDDGAPIFDASRGNVGTANLGATGLKAAHGAIGDQIATDIDGFPVHLGMVARYLICPPLLYQSAKELMHDFTTNEGDLIVRQESRMNATGVLDPRGDVIRTGSSTNWLLAAPADQGPSLVIGTLNGRMEPRIRQFSLDRGQWGVGFDISFDLAVTAVSGKPLYWSSGTAV